MPNFSRSMVVMVIGLLLGCGTGPSSQPTVSPSPAAPPESAPSRAGVAAVSGAEASATEFFPWRRDPVAGEPKLRVSYPSAGPVAALGLSPADMGSFLKPVEVSRESGQYEYLLRLVCPDGRSPSFARNGSVGARTNEAVMPPHILDLYSVRCPDGPEVRVYSDMYHSGREMRVIPGFTLLPDTPARMAKGCPPQLSDNADSNAAHIFTLLEVATPPRITEPQPSVQTGYGVKGVQQVSFVVSAEGKVDTSSIAPGPQGSSATLAAARLVLAKFSYHPAEHHPGCAVPYRVAITLSFDDR